MNGDIRISLLPWREAQRERRKQEFLKILLAALALAGLILVGIDRFYSLITERQEQRNDFLRKETGLLDERIAEIHLLQARRSELLLRMQAVQELQKARRTVARVFDELARQMAPEVFFTSMTMTGSALQIQGYAESASRISEQLRNLEESPWFDEPNVSAIVADELKGGQASSFDLSLQALGAAAVEESAREENSREESAQEENSAAGNSLENNVAEVQP